MFAKKCEISQKSLQNATENFRIFSQNFHSLETLVLTYTHAYSFCLFLLSIPSAYSFCLFLLSISLRTVCFLNPSFSPTLPKIHIRKFTDTRCWVASLKIIQAFKNSMQRSQLLYFLTKRQGDGDKIEN